MADSFDLQCPRCRGQLERSTTSHGIFWACPRCSGRAINVELLRRTFTPDSINPLWLHAIRGEGKASVPCPSCRNTMMEVSLSDDAGVRVDVCKLCHFVWFDMHEVETLRPRPLPEEHAKKGLTAQARQAVAIVKVEQLAKKARQAEWNQPATTTLWGEIADFFGIDT